mgnify:CR=1 FL=1
MNEQISSRETVLKSSSCLTDEQTLELYLISLKARVTPAEYQAYVDDYLASVEPPALSYAIYNYQQLLAMGYSVDEIVKKTVALSAEGIVDYKSEQDESNYWLTHRKNSQSLYLCAMHAGIILGHFSITPVRVKEADEFLAGKRKETEFTVVTQGELETTEHYLYISAVVVRQRFRNSAVATKLIRQSYRLLNRHLAANTKAKGYFAEAYSAQGRKLCELMAMSNIGGEYFIKQYQN